MLKAFSFFPSSGFSPSLRNLMRDKECRTLYLQFQSNSYHLDQKEHSQSANKPGKPLDSFHLSGVKQNLWPVALTFYGYTRSGPSHKAGTSKLVFEHAALSDNVPNFSIPLQVLICFAGIPVYRYAVLPPCYSVHRVPPRCFRKITIMLNTELTS